MTYFDPETVDLAQLTQVLRQTVGGSVVGAVVGRTQLRDAVVQHLGCSMLEGERVVDTLVGRGFVRADHAEDGRELWVLEEL